MAIDFAEFFSLSSHADATQRSTISRSRHRVTFAVRRATPLCGLSITLVVARHLYGEGGSFSRSEVNLSPRQHFVCVEAMLGDVLKWIVKLDKGGAPRPGKACLRVARHSGTTTNSPQEKFLDAITRSAMPLATICECP